jgi:tetratricopeptide (TPR) repeat protein
MSHFCCPNLYGKTMSQALPAKDLSAFKSLPKLVEQKQYKKAFKTIEGILKKFPDHGETLAMKAFLIRTQSPEKKDEAYRVLKKGLAKDIKSHLCWHVYAVLAQQDRHWMEAAKSYRNALKADDKNVKILRELASLLIQVRDTAGYVETRQKLFNIEPGNRVNWIALAVAQHLHGDFEATLKMLQAYEKATENTPTEMHIQSEFQLFKNTVIEQAKSAQDALSHLEQVTALIPDKVTLKERKVDLCLKAGKLEEAEQVYRELLHLNPENYNYYTGLQKAMGLSPDGSNALSAEQVSKLHVTLAEIQKLFPRASAPMRIVLDFLEGDAFSTELANYVRPRLRSGKPSLFSELKSLYVRPDGFNFQYLDKVKRIEEQIEGYLSSLHANNKFVPSDTQEESPSSLLFTLYFAVQHYDARGDYSRALQLVEEAITHTATLTNLYAAKARIYKHAGNYKEAAAQMEIARKLDLADRYLNTMSAKYQLRAGLKEHAEAVVGLFTKWDAAGQSNLYEMQASWYELALAAAYHRTGDLPNAITQYGNVLKHFQDFEEDQLDFHAYCIRKLTLRAYLDMLGWEDRLHTHRFYYRAASELVKCYLEWLEQKEQRASVLSEQSNGSKLDFDSEEAKTKRKEESKKRRAEAKARSASSAPAEENKEEKPSASTTIDMNQVDALAEATKLVRTLEKSHAEKVLTHVLAAQIYLHAGQYPAALNALKKATELQPHHPDVHRSLIRVFHHGAKADLPAETKKELEAASASLLGSRTLEQVNNAFLTEHADSLAHLLAGAEMKLLLGGAEKRDEAASVLSGHVPCATIQDAEKAYLALKNTFQSAAAAESFRQQAHQRFPLASAFAPPSANGDDAAAAAAPDVAAAAPADVRNSTPQ